MKVYLLMFSLFFVSFHSFAQETEAQKNRNNSIVTGKIIDINGLPLIGAKISAKGITKETKTNFDGKFTLGVEDETIIYISFVGFETIEALVKPQANITFLLKEKGSMDVATRVTRKEMRKLRRDNKKVTNDGSALVEQVFYILEAIAKNN